MNEDIKFLIDLQHELKTQDTDYQASPRYWSIMDYKEVPGNEDFDSGKIKYCHSDGDHVTFENFTDLKTYIINSYSDDTLSITELQALFDKNSFEDLWEYVETNFYGYYSVFVNLDRYIATSTLFLTKKEAEDHLEKNHRNYHEKAHIYAMTAWRAPKVERLLNILENFDWQKLIKED